MVARDVFVVSAIVPNSAPPDGTAVSGVLGDVWTNSHTQPVQWTAVATVTHQTLVWNVDSRRLELVKRAVGICPEVEQHVLDGFLREHNEKFVTQQTGNARTEAASKTVKPRAFDTETRAFVEAVSETESFRKRK